MINITFFKYQGAGNDFLLIDNRNLEFSHLTEKNINLLCNRRFGIGADGLMMLQSHPDHDFEMQYYNADGRIGSMCGNGGRCIVAFAKTLGIIHHDANFLAVDGAHYAKISGDGTWVDLQMIDVDQIKKDADAFVLDTGSPHYVLEVKDLQDMDVFTEGKKIRNNSTYKEKGINVNFIEDKGDHFFIRTFERGVEDETYACGTGVTAVALAKAQELQQTGHFSKEIKVLGGDMRVEYDYDGLTFSNIFLCGPAKLVFTGQITL